MARKMARKKMHGWHVALHVHNDKNNGRGEGKVISFPSRRNTMLFIKELIEEHWLEYARGLITFALPARCPDCSGVLEPIYAASVCEADGMIHNVKFWWDCKCLNTEGLITFQASDREIKRFLRNIHRKLGDVFPGYGPEGPYRADPNSPHFLLLTQGHAEVEP